MQKNIIHFLLLTYVKLVNSVLNFVLKPVFNFVLNSVIKPILKSAFFKLLFYMVQNAILTAAFIGLAYLLSLLHERTFGEKWYLMDEQMRLEGTFEEKWYHMDDRILRGVFIIVNVIAAFQFIVLNVFHAYTTLREELRNANSRDNNNGNN